MRSKALVMLLAMGLAGALDYSQNREYYEPTKKKKDLGKKYPTSKQGQKTFKYDDGFCCRALNQKSADKKHSKWLKSKSIDHA